MRRNGHTEEDQDGDCKWLKFTVINDNGNEIFGALREVRNHIYPPDTTSLRRGGSNVSSAHAKDNGS